MHRSTLWGRPNLLAAYGTELYFARTVSGVCTHPDYHGRGYAAGLMSEIGRGILARSETPFLHAVADDLGAIALYQRLGFAIRWRPLLMVFRRENI